MKYYVKAFAISLGVVFGSEVIFRWMVRVYHSWRQYQMAKTFTKAIFFPDKGIVYLSPNQPDDANNSSECDSENNNTFQHPKSVNSKYTRSDTMGVKGRPLDIWTNPFGYPELKPVVKVTPLDLRVDTFAVPESERVAVKSKSLDLMTNPFSFPEPVNQQNEFSLWNNGNGSRRAPEVKNNYLSHSSSLIHIIKVIEKAKRSLKICVYVFTSKDLIDAVVRAKVSYRYCM